MPAASFAEELIAAYPEAKVVILNRNVDRWYESMAQTVLKYVTPGSPMDKLRDLIDWRETGQRGPMFEVLMGGMFRPGPDGLTESCVKEYFIGYHENLRRIVPKERLLEYKVQDGYKPLCEFLQVPVPTQKVDGKEIEEAFPRINEGAAFADRIHVMRKLQTERILRKVGYGVSVVCFVGAGLCFWYQ
jgi:Sulfotransferase domain